MQNAQLKSLLELIVVNTSLHSLWLNTLSYLENCGAKKIALSEHPTEVHVETLKHAAEEFRHAYHLKRQLKKIRGDSLKNYERENLIGGFNTLQYLNKLELVLCRLLKKEYSMRGIELKQAAYHLITYAIETRASSLYPLYQEILNRSNSPLSMKAIIVEEDCHLQDILSILNTIPNCKQLQNYALQIESLLFEKWLVAIKTEILQKLDG